MSDHELSAVVSDTIPVSLVDDIQATLKKKYEFATVTIERKKLTSRTSVIGEVVHRALLNQGSFPGALSGFFTDLEALLSKARKAAKKSRGDVKKNRVEK